MAIAVKVAMADTVIIGKAYPRSRAEAVAAIAASPETLFDYFEDQASPGSHRQKAMMILGGKMWYTFDHFGGWAVGSIIGMQGLILGLNFTVEISDCRA